MSETPFHVALLSGGAAGTTVDVVLFPLDTLKTRMQSPQGFIKAGGFRGIYKGLSAAAMGSAPGAALFFCTYEKMKSVLKETGHFSAPMVHMGAASLGEVMACLVRVPTEVVKQRMQTGMHNSMRNTIQHTLKHEGYMGLYMGFGVTIMREVPFSLIQFPLYEYLKGAMTGTDEPNSASAATAGCVSGALAAAATTPLDVLKTRLMLGKDLQGVPYKGAIDAVTRLVQGECLLSYVIVVESLMILPERSNTAYRSVKITDSHLCRNIHQSVG